MVEGCIEDINIDKNGVVECYIVEKGEIEQSHIDLCIVQGNISKFGSKNIHSVKSGVYNGCVGKRRIVESDIPHSNIQKCGVDEAVGVYRHWHLFNGRVIYPVDESGIENG